MQSVIRIRSGSRSRESVRGRDDRNPELIGYTGHLFEWEVLGTCRVLSHGYMSFHRAMDEVVRNQPNDPHHPRGESANLFTAVADEMAKDGFDSDGLELFTAIGSTLDRFHKVDGFFRFHGVTVTLDTTLDPCKKFAKADVIVHGDDAVNGYPDAARDVARRFRNRKDRMIGVGL